MRRFTLICLLVCASSLFAQQTPSQHGIQLGDLDRNAQPCNDFSQYANGSWHAQNPIPAYMDRWSRRWQAGETNKEKLKEILDEVARREWPAHSVEQLVSDHYASCMDEARIDQAGVAPIAPLLKNLDGLETAADVQAFCARRLAAFKVPERIEFVESLPRTSVGKIQKNVVRDELE